MAVGTKYGPSVTAKVQLIDFAQNNEAAFQSLGAVIEPLDVGVLGEPPLLPFVYSNETNTYASKQRRKISRNARGLCRHTRLRNRRHPYHQHQRHPPYDLPRSPRHEIPQTRSHPQHGLLRRRSPLPHARDLLRLQGLPHYLLRRACARGQEIRNRGFAPEHVLRGVEDEQAAQGVAVGANAGDIRAECTGEGWVGVWSGIHWAARDVDAVLESCDGGLVDWECGMGRVVC